MLLETERLIIRRLTDDDFVDFFVIAADKEMCRLMGRADLTNIINARITFNWLKDREECGCAIILKETGQFIGNLTVSMPSRFVEGHPALEGRQGRSLSFCISREYRRRGFMFEAVSAVIDHLFSERNMDFVNCGYFHFNEPSKQLQEKLGFKNLLKTHVYFNEDIDIYENILWNERKTG